MRLRPFFLASTLAAVMLFIGCENTSDPAADNVLRVGALIPMTGAGSNLGTSGSVAMQLAVKDFNTFLAIAESPFTLELDTLNTNSSPATAVEKLRELNERGIRFVVGPYTSAESVEVLKVANQLGMILISPSAVANSLTIPNDNFFRTITDVTMQGQAAAEYLAQDSIKYVVALKRNDVWGDDLLKVLKSAYTARGGSIVEEITYAPSTTDFTPQIAQLRTALMNAIAQYGAKNVAVGLMCLGEGIDILTAVSQDPTFAEVHWMGNSAIARDPRLLSNHTVAEFAQRVHLNCAVFGLDPLAESKWGPVSTRVKEILGREADSYALAAYDAVYLQAYNALDAGTDDIAKLRKIVMENASTTFGVTGWTVMDENGDRRSSSFDFWAIRFGLGGSPEWYRSAAYVQGAAGFELKKF